MVVPSVEIVARKSEVSRGELACGQTGAVENELRPGTLRVGWIHTERNRESVIEGWTLQADGELFRLIHASRGFFGLRDQVTRWASDGSTGWGDDPDRTKYQYGPPEILWFVDSSGCVTLTKPAGFGHRRSGYGDRVELRYRRAVLGGPTLTDYRRINGLRSELPGLRGWMAVATTQPVSTLDNEGKVVSVSFSVTAPAAVRLTRNLNLEARPSFSTRRDGDTFAVDELLYIQSQVRGPARPWDEHLVLHRAVRDLLRVSSWMPMSFGKQFASHTDDRQRTADGKSFGPRWSGVETPKSSPPPVPDRHDFLFRFGDINGGPGVRRWLRIRSDFWRGLAPLLDLVEDRRAPVDIRVAQAAIGLDAIGYQLVLESGRTPSEARRMSHASLLRRVWRDMSVHPDVKQSYWVDLGNRCYQGTKHADRESASLDELLEVEKLHQLVFRLWVAQRLGMERGVLADRLSTDSMSLSLSQNR